MQLFCNDAEWNRCKAREKRASLAFRILAAAVPAAFIVLCLLILTVNPIGAHSIAKGAYKNGIRPDKEMEIDDYRRDFDE